ncbi:uncharacterized protein [Watersipora subatra]|uniref:uncharacterized protein n=1 Tax=Watersipora subatra TaxID=2589382 RepID=UPI00355C2A52
MNLSRLEALCEHHQKNPICISLRFEGEITVDDVDYVVDIPSNDKITAIVGCYMPAILAVVGVLGNLTCLSVSILRKRSTEMSVYINFLTVLNIVYLCTASLSQSLRAAGLTPIEHRHYLLCMLWPPTLELLSNISSWTVVVLTTHARMLCLMIVLAMLFLNFHITFLRELHNGKCAISSKAGIFYRDITPWIRITCSTYAMLLLPYEYSLVKEVGKEGKQETIILYLQLARELCGTAMHSLAFIPILIVIQTRTQANNDD